MNIRKVPTGSPSLFVWRATPLVESVAIRRRLLRSRRRRLFFPLGEQDVWSNLSNTAARIRSRIRSTFRRAPAYSCGEWRAHSCMDDGW